MAWSARRRRPSGSVRLVDATPTRLPMTTRRLIATLVSATFWWISLLAKRVRAESSAGDEGLGLGDAIARREREGGLGQGERVATPIVVHRLASYHLPTPTWTSRNRAPDTAWPTWPVWPGSPLPQFGVPSIA